LSVKVTAAGQLSRQFRLACGESPYGYLMTRRIERATALLRRGDLSVTEVCFAVGCSSLGTFSSRFTRPGRYAAQHLPAPRGARDGEDAVVRGKAGHQTDTLGFEAATASDAARWAGSRSAPPTSPARRFPSFPFVLGSTRHTGSM
jgi:hypothetical protein